jgi:hypothetical protein
MDAQNIIHQGKDESYYRNKIRQFYSSYEHDTGYVTNAQFANGSSKRSLSELRDYGRGVQPISKYLIELGFDEKEVQKFTDDNISFAPSQVYLKYRNIIISKLMDLKLTPTTRAVDQYANFEKLLKKNLAKLKRQTQTIQNSPIKINPNDGFPAGITPEMVERHFTLGEMLLPIEVMMKDALDITFLKSKWDSIKKMLYEDLVDLGGMACDIIYRNGRLVVDYVDYSRVIMRSSIYPDFRDSDIRGYTRYRKLSDIRMIDPEFVARNYDRLKKYEDQGSNITLSHNQQAGHREDYTSSSSMWTNNSDFGIKEVKFYWLDTEELTFVEGVHNRGSKIFEKVPPGFELSDRAKRAQKKLNRYTIQKMYTATWLVNDDLIYNYGEVDWINLNGQYGADTIMWPMNVFTTQEMSITEKVIPHIDDVVLALFKRRDLIKKIPPGPRMIIYKDRLKDKIKLGDKTYNVKDMLKMYQREGLFIADEQREWSLPGEQPHAYRPPIDFINTGAQEDISILDSTIFSGLRNIQIETGMNEITDGSNPNPDMLKFVAENLKLATNNALRPTLTTYIDFFKELNQTLCWRYQRIAAVGKYQLGILPVLGGTSKIVEIGPELLNHDFNIEINVIDNDQYQMLIQDLMSKKELIPVEGYFAVLNALTNGDFKKAELYLIEFTNQVKKIEHERQLQLTEHNAKANQAAAMEAEKMRQETLQLEIQLKSQILQLESQLKEGQASRDHVRKLEIIKLTEALKARTAAAVTSINNQNRLQQ